MRLSKVLVIPLMLMAFGTGFGTTTSDLKQNSETVIVQNEFVQSVTIEAVSVVEFQAVSLNETQLFESSDVAHFILKNNFNPNQYAVIRDVGWNSWSKAKEIPYTEKLLENYNLDFKEKLLIVNLVRDNC